MDFLDPAKKRAHQRRLFIGYFLVGVAIIIGSVILAYQSLGYGIDRRTGQIIQNGLLFISGHPEAADIYINGVHKGKTDARLTLPSGEYSLQLKRDGYRDWQRAFNLGGGSVERLDYPILFPTKLVTTDVKLYDVAPAVQSSSPDNHWLLVNQPASLGSFDVYDLSDVSKAPTLVSLPAGLLTPDAGQQQLTVTEWADDNRHVLLQHALSDGQQEYILLDREVPALSLNLSKTFATSPGVVSLKEKKYDQYYFFTPSLATLSVANLKDRSLKLLLSNVLAYKDHEPDTIIYVTDDGAALGRIKVKIHDSAGEHIVRDLPAGAPYLVDITKYNGDWYAAVGAVNEPKVYIYKNPVAKLGQNPSDQLVPASVIKITNPGSLSFSANSQFVEAEHGSNFAVYDIENDRRYQYDIKLPVDGTGQAAWADNSHLDVVSGGKAAIFDYDGANIQTLSDANLLPHFDFSNNTLYAIAPSVAASNHAALTRTDLKVKK